MENFKDKSNLASVGTIYAYGQGKILYHSIKKSFIYLKSRFALHFIKLFYNE